MYLTKKNLRGEEGSFANTVNTENSVSLLLEHRHLYSFKDTFLKKLFYKIVSCTLPAGFSIW